MVGGKAAKQRFMHRGPIATVEYEPNALVEVANPPQRWICALFYEAKRSESATGQAKPISGATASTAQSWGLQRV
jgi:hypothetical protein